MQWIIRGFIHCLFLGMMLNLFYMIEAGKTEAKSDCGGIRNCVKCVRSDNNSNINNNNPHNNNNNKPMVGGSFTSSPSNLPVIVGNAAAAANMISSPYRCVKCGQLIVMHTRECVSDCPLGYVEEWSTSIDYMGRVCRESTVVAGIPLTGQKFAIVLGASVGIVVCVVLVTSGSVYLKYRRRKCLKKTSTRQSPSLGHLTGTHRSQDSDDSERPEFLKQLGFLKPDAPIFLAMLNETRKQVRESRRSVRQNNTLQAYRPVLKDLSRILILLNRPDNSIGTPPGDWETLLAWGERVLRRYKKQNPDQVAQLLGFSQLPLEEPESPILGHSPYPTQLTTFHAGANNNNITNDNNGNCSKHLSPSTSATHLQQLAISAFDAAYNNRNRRTAEEDELAVLRRDEMSAIFSRSSNYDTANDYNYNNNGAVFDSSSSCAVRKKDGQSVGGMVTMHPEWATLRSTRAAAAMTGIGSRQHYYVAPNEEDDFYTLGFRPQDKITTEL